MVRSATGPTSASEGVRKPPVSTTESVVPSSLRVPLNTLLTRSEFVTIVTPGTSSRYWASANVVVPPATAIAVPGVTRFAAVRAMAVFSGCSRTSLASKPRLVASGRARQHRAAVDLLDQAIPGQHLKVPADGHIRNAEPLGEIADPGAAIVPDGLQDERLAVSG